MYPKLILKQGKERSLLRKHPWVFSGAINRNEGEVREGDIVEIFDFNGNYLATGHFQPSSITARIFSFNKTDASTHFWKSKLEDAFILRKEAGVFTNNNVFRLVNAEGDGMPGLIIDYYNGIFVMQCHSAGMYFISGLLGKIIREMFEKKNGVLNDACQARENNIFFKGIYNKSSDTLPFKAGIEAKNGFIFPDDDEEKKQADGVFLIEDLKHKNGHETACNSEVIVKEYDWKFIVDIAGGQKTGFFIDQRENRKLAGSFCAGKKVLNAFSYTGGFSVYALGGSASMVQSVDSSAGSIEIAERNIKLNFKETKKHGSFCEDVFKFLGSSGEKFDVIILDPPAFAKHTDALKQGLRGYERLNELALNRLNKKGFLFTFSCSQVVSKDSFRTAVFRASIATKKEVKIIYQLSQPCDHPVSIFHPEGEYLKGLVLQAV